MTAYIPNITTLGDLGSSLNPEDHYLGLAGPGSQYGAGSSEGGPAWAAALRPPHHYNTNQQQGGGGLRLQGDRESVSVLALAVRE